MVEAQQREHLDSGVEGGVCVGLGGREKGGSHHGEDAGEDIWKHYTAHTVTIFSHAQLILFAASSAQGESMSGQNC